MLLADLGLAGYSSVHRLMLSTVDKRIKDEIGDVLLLVEHEHVYTVGRRLHDREIKGLPAPLYKVERGGGVTYHGPGMLIAYPIVKLPSRGMDVKRFIWSLEETVICSLRTLGIVAVRNRDHPGVWVGNKKIASIGLALKSLVTYHGLAVNVSPDMSFFSAINPCGLPPETMTSLNQLLGERIDMKIYKELFIKSFCKVFNVDLLPIDLDMLSCDVLKVT